MNKWALWWGGRDCKNYQDDDVHLDEDDDDDDDDGGDGDEYDDVDYSDDDDDDHGGGDDDDPDKDDKDGYDDGRQASEMLAKDPAGFQRTGQESLRRWNNHHHQYKSPS